MGGEGTKSRSEKKGQGGHWALMKWQNQGSQKVRVGSKGWWGQNQGLKKGQRVLTLHIWADGQIHTHYTEWMGSQTQENLEQVCIEKHWYISRNFDLLTPLRRSESDNNRIPKGSSGQLAQASFHSMYSVSKTPVHPSAWSLVRKRRLVEVLVGVGVGVVGVGVAGVWGDFLLAGREVSTTRYTIPSLPCFMQHYFRLVKSEGFEVYDWKNHLGVEVFPL